MDASNISSDSGEYTVIIDNTNFMAASEILWVYGPQSSLNLLFRIWRF